MQNHLSRTAIAAALAIAFQPAIAAVEDAAAVVVTATRFAEADPRIPANISVISRNEIESSPAITVPELLQTRAGISLRSLTGTIASSATVDLRGFGDSAASNTLILLDGQRLNPIDSATIDWSTIPLNAVRRIEILRGSGTVLYGDRASGGVINIITDKSDKASAKLAATIGSRGYQAADAQAAGGSGSAYYNLSAHYAQENGWRQNSQADQQSAAGRVGYRITAGEVFIDFAAAKSSAGNPGSLFTNQYRNQPEMARFPLNHQFAESHRLRPGLSIALGDTLHLEAELGSSSAESHSRMFAANGSPSYRSDRSSDTLSATPRLRWNHGLGNLDSETVLGLDYYDGDVSNPSWGSFSGTNTQRAAQESVALYFQNITALTKAFDLTVGARNQRVKQHAADANAGMSNSVTRSRDAWELGLAARPTDSLRLFGRGGRSFRFPNTDELFGFDPNPPWGTIFNGDLKPQQGTIWEAGGSWRLSHTLMQAALFRMDLTDEISYDGASGANVNLPPTRRQGIELEGQWRPADSWRTRLAYTLTDAEFRGGSNHGKTVPLVPRHKLSAAATWLGGSAGSWSVLVNHVGNQRYSGDPQNIRGMMSSFTTVDLRASWDLRPWTVSARIANLFDRRYATMAGYSTTYSDHYYYPAEPRSVFISAQYGFR